jgi:hypothetical protein
MKFVVKLSATILVDAEDRSGAIHKGRVEVMMNPTTLIASEVSRDPIMIHNARSNMVRD